MLRRILVAVDDSGLNDDVFEQALALAQVTSACLGILHVADPDERGDQDLPAYLANVESYLEEEDESDPRCFVGHFEEFERDLFGVHVDRATSVGVSAECIYCFGDPERSICDLAAAWKADLIVLGRRGRSGMVEFFLGSVSNYVVHHAPCSVYIAHRTAETQADAPSGNPMKVSL